MILNSLEYDRMAAVKRGDGTLDPLLADLTLWVKASLNLPVVGFTCDQRKKPNPATLLRMLVERTADIDELCQVGQTRHLDFRFKNEILDKFTELAGKHLRTDICLENMIFTLWCFESEAMEVCQALSIADAEKLFHSSYAHLPIHQLSFHFGLHVFYEKEEDVNAFEEDGTNARIRQDYYQVLKGHDEFDFITPDTISITFDSHENVVKNYQGNYFYYFR